MSILNNYSNEEFAKIVAESKNYRDCLHRLGYNSQSGNTTKLLKERIANLNLSIEHFHTPNAIKRNEENIFIKNSTANQATLRRWYRKGNYTEYKCSICGQEPFWNGKELTLILDHINGVNNDDRLENLHWVCPNCNYQLETTNGKNKKHKEHNLNYCVDCGTLISKSAVRCIKCNIIYRNNNSEIISREELKKLIRTLPFTKIGERFGVSDNAVRKWCDKYNLPRKVSDIKKISDDDWKKI